MGMPCCTQFEKDDDTNYHMDMIAGLANMRARNYTVAEVDKLKAKLIAGRIIPAIATATACATGVYAQSLNTCMQSGTLLHCFLLQAHALYHGVHCLDNDSTSGTPN